MMGSEQRGDVPPEGSGEVQPAHPSSPPSPSFSSSVAPPPAPLSVSAQPSTVSVLRTPARGHARDSRRLGTTVIPSTVMPDLGPRPRSVLQPRYSLHLPRPTAMRASDAVAGCSYAPTEADRSSNRSCCPCQHQQAPTVVIYTGSDSSKVFHPVALPSRGDGGSDGKRTVEGVPSIPSPTVVSPLKVDRGSSPLSNSTCCATLHQQPSLPSVATPTPGLSGVCELQQVRAENWDSDIACRDEMGSRRLTACKPSSVFEVKPKIVGPAPPSGSPNATESATTLHEIAGHWSDSRHGSHQNPLLSSVFGEQKSSILQPVASIASSETSMDGLREPTVRQPRPVHHVHSYGWPRVIDAYSTRGKSRAASVASSVDVYDRSVPKVISRAGRALCAFVCARYPNVPSSGLLRAIRSVLAVAFEIEVQVAVQRALLFVLLAVPHGSVWNICGVVALS
jgi:hypothetical protein